MDWITCGGCGLKHSRRPDGLCPRCRQPDAGAFAAGAMPAPGAVAPPAGGPAAAGPGSAPSGWGQPPPSPWAQPAPSASGQPPPSAWAQPASSASGQPPPSAWAQPASSAWGQPAPSGWAQPSAHRSLPEIAVGSLVSRAFSTWWKDAWRYALLLLLVYLPLILAAGAGGATAVVIGGVGKAPSPALLRSVLPLLGLGAIGTFVMACVHMGGSAWAAVERLGGRPVTLGGMIGAGFRRFWTLLGANVVAGLLWFAATLALIVPGIFVAVALCPIDAVVMAEPVGVGGALERAFALTKGSRWTLFLSLLVLGLAIWTIDLSTSAIGKAVPHGAGGIAVAWGLLAFVVQIAASSLWSVFCAVAYHDLRLAREGVDTSGLARVFE